MRLLECWSASPLCLKDEMGCIAFYRVSMCFSKCVRVSVMEAYDMDTACMVKEKDAKRQHVVF